jgi:hemerythrin superfamily protein
MAAEQDVVDLLLEQHNQIKTLFGQVAVAHGDKKRELFEDLVRLLAVHETAEEEVVHPAARRKIDDGDDIVDSRLEEEDQAKHALADLYDLGVDHPEFDNRLKMLASEVIRHATNEEKEEFSRLRDVFKPAELRKMAGAVKAAEAMAPTRPHPMAGESAAANLLAGPPLAVFDRARDAMRDWTSKSKSRK